MLQRLTATRPCMQRAKSGNFVRVDDLVLLLRERQQQLPSYQPGCPELYGHSNGQHELIRDLLTELGEA